MIELGFNSEELDIHFTVDKLDASNADAVKSIFKAADISTVREAHIHMDHVQFLDSSGVGALLSMYKSFQAQSASVILMRPTPPVLSVLELLRLHRIFTIKME